MPRLNFGMAFGVTHFLWRRLSWNWFCITPEDREASVADHM